MNRLMREELADLRKRYPRGCHVKLIRMNDPYCRDLKPGDDGHGYACGRHRYDSRRMGLWFYAGCDIRSRFLCGCTFGRRKTE